LLEEIDTFFTGNELEEKTGKRQLILEDLREEIRKCIVSYAKQRKLSYYVSEDGIIKMPVKNFSQVKTMWRHDGGNDCFKGMIHICYLDFDTNPDWKKHMEKWVLQNRGLEYLGEPEKAKRAPSRCVLILVNKAKQDVVKSLKDVGINAHGRSLSLRDNENQLEKSRKGKRQRRKPGMWYEYFYNLCPVAKESKNRHIWKSPRKKVSSFLIGRLQQIKLFFSPLSKQTEGANK
jgi:hypothetical protein